MLGVVPLCHPADRREMELESGLPYSPYVRLRYARNGCASIRSWEKGTWRSFYEPLNLAIVIYLIYHIRSQRVEFY
jgi:hypothetical protein